MSSKTTNYDLNKYTSDDGILATIAGLSANMDIIDTNMGGSSYELPTASTSTLGGVKIDGTSIKISNGVISAKDYIDEKIGNIDTLLTNLNSGGGVS